VHLNVPSLDLDEGARLSDSGAELLHVTWEEPQAQVGCQIARRRTTFASVNHHHGPWFALEDKGVKAPGDEAAEAGRRTLYPETSDTGMESEAAYGIRISAKVLRTGEFEPAPNAAVLAPRGREADALLVWVGVIRGCDESNARYPLLRPDRLGLEAHGKGSRWIRRTSLDITGTAAEGQSTAKGEGGCLMITVHGDLLAARTW
jgi:hypothetical protein